MMYFEVQAVISQLLDLDILIYSCECKSLIALYVLLNLSVIFYRYRKISSISLILYPPLYLIGL